MNYIKVFVLVLLFNIISFAQEENPFNYFPHKVGDFWNYATYHNLNVVYIDYLITRDSTDADGNKLIFINNWEYPEFKICKDSYVICNPKFTPNRKMYKLNAQLYEEWWVSQDEYFGIKGKVMVIGYLNIFGELRKVKRIDYYNVYKDIDTNITPNSSLYRYTHLLAEGFGKIEVLGADGPPFYLAGCIINNKVYGYTNIDKSIELPNKFNLSQNYPNPFNPSTTIEYEIEDGGHVEIEIIDLIGRRIEILVSEYKHPGKYKVKFNSKNTMASGIYFYKLKKGNKSIIKKMMLIK